MNEYLLIAGMSGAGRSTAAAALEDAGWYVIDNLPPSLLGEVAQAVSQPGSEIERVALVAGRGGGAQVEEALPAIEALSRGGDRVTVVFLDAPDEVLVKRFEGTRRRHPIPGVHVEEAISDERRLLQGIRSRADVILDTGELNVNQLRRRIFDLFGAGSESPMRTSVVSFGFQHGVPLDADLIFDCRFLPNPNWVEELRPLNGLDEAVRSFVLAQEATGPFLDRLDDLLAMLVPAYLTEGKSYLTIAVGCTGGRHRSVVLAEELARRLTESGCSASVLHRDKDR
jgi:RNase adapter protein RapZ